MTGSEPELADIVARLRRAMRRAGRTADPGNPLSVAQLELLSCLAENPGAQPSQVARKLRLAPNSVTTLVNGLRKRELVTSAGGTEDRRTVRLELTGDGEAAVRRWQTTNARILGEALGKLHPGWQHVLSAALPALHELVGAIDELADDHPV
ncbi:MarR family transcriptional regulator [Amycolatopsis acidicola]|uniref:MarR family transcriptional regulator n=1 Tax=Amycolatopsis acidicola TaxID=2596893 RepID=A0A5N0UPP2_9PSEU|nr:MarR family transcriptional regulator [Amycolatopsis acidicola]KAA9152772.1 MarR family transcriptional regulator [Amycolatopsis acidicola]